MLRSVVNDQLWTWDEDHSVVGLDLGVRSTIVRLADGTLWVHSPLSPDDEMRAALDALGPVSNIVVPNTMHYLGAKNFAASYPDAKVYATPALADSSKIPPHTSLIEEAEPAWQDVLEQLLFRGHKISEVIFWHRPSRTLIVTDTVFYLREGNRATRLYAKIAKVAESPGPTMPFKWMTRDHNAARASVERLLQWDFGRIIMAHGAIYEGDGNAILREKFAWLLDK